MMMLPRNALSLVSCNVYISAGRPHYKDLLVSLLDRCQQRCHQLRTNQIQPIASQEFFQSSTSIQIDNNEMKDKNNRNDGDENQRKITLVHAYADIPYDRSSFHLAGNAYLIADVVSFLALDAIHSLKDLNESKLNNDTDNNNDDDKNEGGDESRHPLIGLVDHISVMPLYNENQKESNQNDIYNKDDKNNGKAKNIDSYSYIPSDAHGISCRYIGEQLQLKNKDIDILYYGSANPTQTPLATIRREQTKFFKSGGLEKTNNTNDTKPQQQFKKNQCTIGSPPYFVENYNILLSKNVNKQNAMKLTKMVRARDGGIVGVEALTLPYSDGRFEVACNLLRPKEGSVDDIELVLNQWVDQQQQEQQSDVKCDKSFLVDDSYRVGTTADQCMKVLNDCQIGVGSEEYWKNHDDNVRKRFESYFS